MSVLQETWAVPWADLAADHLDMSPLDLAFREYASQDPDCLSQATFAELNRPNPLLRYHREAWPIFIGAAKVRELARVSVGLSQLIRAIPERLFGNDPSAVAAYYGISPIFAEIILDPPSGIPGALSRGDFIYGRAGFQCVEFNMSSSLGGWETTLLSEMLFRVPALRRFMDGAGVAVATRHTLRELLTHVVREALRDGLIEGDELHTVVGSREVGMLSSFPEIPRYLEREYDLALRAGAPFVGGTIAIRDYADLAQRGECLYYRDQRLHAVIERSVSSHEEPTFRCFKAGTINLYNGPAATIQSDKRNIALLSESQESDVWNAEERALIRSHVPWVRRLVPGETRYRGEVAALEDVVLSQRANMVIKKAVSLGGAHVILGRFTSPEEWAAAVRQAQAGGDWVVQEHVESLPYLFQHGESGCCPHDVVWGPFVFGTTYGGAILRVQPKALQGIVNLTRGAKEAILLEVDDASARPRAAV